jgi:N-acetylneuraminate lyase
MNRKTHGLIAATFTPMHADGSINLDPIPAITDHLAESGMTGIYVTGSTGEGPSLSDPERRSVLEAYIRAAGDRMIVFAQVGQDSITQARELATYAKSIGAGAISAVTPTYFKPASVKALVEAMAHIAGGAPELPFYYYHIPMVTGVAFDVVEFLKLGSQRIPNLVGVKYTASTLHELQACIEFEGGRFDMLSGFDEMLLPALAVGATAAVGSTFNFAAPVYHNVLRAFAAGDLAEARRWQSKSIDIVRAFVPYGGREAQKAMMKMIGFDCGPARPPLMTVDGERYDMLRADLEAVGFFDLQTQTA